MQLSMNKMQKKFPLIFSKNLFNSSRFHKLVAKLALYLKKQKRVVFKIKAGKIGFTKRVGTDATRCASSIICEIRKTMVRNNSVRLV